MENSYLSVDLETTGLNPKTDKIIEIGACKVIDGRIEETFHTLVNPRRELGGGVMDLTHISDEMLLNAPIIEDVLEDFIAFSGRLPLLGHHIIFDFSFLKRAAVNLGLCFERSGIDTLTLCRTFMPEDEKKNLTAACSYYQAENRQAHRALSDAEAAHSLYQELRKRFLTQKPEAFLEKPLIYKVKREQRATKRQKEHLRDLVKYHKINLTVDIDYMSRNEISRITDRIISQFGKI